MKYQNIFDYAKEKGIEYLLINSRKVTSLDFEVSNDKLKKYTSSIVTTYLITAYINNRNITFETENLKNYSKIIDELIDDASLLEETTNNFYKIKENIINKEKILLSSNFDIKLKELLSLHEFLNVYPLLTNIDACYGESITEIEIHTSDNKYLRDINKVYYFTTEVFATNDGINSSSYAIKESTKDEIDIKKTVLNTIEDTLNKLNCQTINSGRYKVLLTNEVSANILESFISIFSALSIEKKISLLTDKLDQKVFSSKLNIIEDPNNKDYIGKRLFDDEGNKTKYKEIIKEGIFKQALYDNQTSLKEKKDSTGNSYGKIWTRNLHIQKGSTSYEDLIKQMHTGIIINEIQGMHAGINKTNGDISLQAAGYYVENSQVKYPVKLFVLVTNIFELYKNISDIGSDLEFFDSSCGSPSLLVDNIQISK